MDRDSKTENDIKKEYLSRYIKAVRREKRILEEIQRLREDKMFPSVVNDGMPKGNKKSDLSEFAALIDEEIEKLKRERLEKVRAYSDISKKIKAVENDNEREVLELRYIKGMKWEEICLEMSYSWKHIHRIHSSALKNFNMT